MTATAEWLSGLRSLLGADAVLTEAGDTERYLADWTGRFRGEALAVVRPASTEEVAEVVRRCAAAGVAVVPQGGNTGLVGGGVPASGDQARVCIVLCLERMRAVRDLDPVADTLTVEAGVVLADLHDAVAEVDRLFPVSLGSQGSCTVGGIVSTNAGGTSVLRYGMTRELVLGLEVVLPDGRVWDGLRALRKDNTGYDLKQLFVGAEGTLGVVTAALLRMVPATPRRATALLALSSVGTATDLLPVLRAAAGEQLTTWELFNRASLDLVLAHLPGARDPFREPYEWYALVEVAGGGDEVDARLEAALSAAVEGGGVPDVVVAGSPAQREGLWLLREGISEAQRVEGVAVKHDVSVPIASLAELVARLEERVPGVLPGVRLITYGHVGDGNLHYNLSAPAAVPDSLLPASGQLTAAVYEVVADLGGSISAEHGLGVLKRDAAAELTPAVELDLMRAVKAALDPAGLMNPGKVLPES